MSHIDLEAELAFLDKRILELENIVDGILFDLEELKKNG